MAVRDSGSGPTGQLNAAAEVERAQLGDAHEAQGPEPDGDLIDGGGQLVVVAFGVGGGEAGMTTPATASRVAASVCRDPLISASCLR